LNKPSVPAPCWALWLLAAAGVVCAQDVTLLAGVDRSTIRENESFTYTLSVQGQVRDEPDVTTLTTDFEVLQRSRNSSIQILGGSTSQVTEWRFQLMPTGPGSFTLPPIELAGVVSNPVELQVLPALAGDAPGDIFLEVEIEPAAAYVQSQVIYTQRLYRAVSTGRSSLTPPEVTGGEAIVVALEGREYQTVRDDRTFIVLERRYAVFPQAAGELTIEPMVFEAVVITQSGFSSLQRFRSEPVSLSVLPAVAPPPLLAGAAWLPAQGVAIEQRWSGDPEQFTAGIPQTRTLRVEVQGVLETQIPDLSIFQGDSFQQYSDQPELSSESSADGTRAVRTERFAVIAQSPGALTIPAVEMPWFNVDSRQWEVARIEPQEVTVLPSREIDLGAPAPQPTPAQAPLTTGDAGPRLWQGISAALLAAWMLTLSLWWRSGRRERAAVRREPAAEAPRAAPERRVLRQLRAACSAGDAEQARRLLLDWGATRFGERPQSLGRLAAMLPADLAAAIGELERSLYGPGSPDWEGGALREALVQADAVTRARPAKAGERELLPLYR